MKAVRLESVGRIFARDVAMTEPGENDVLIRVEVAGICGTDRHLLRGEFPSSPPVTLGHEFCGIVQAVGQAVGSIRPGTRVTGDPNIACGRCDYCHAGRINLCRNLQAIGIHRDGGFAEFVVIPERQAHELPSTLKPQHGAFCEPLACCLHGVDLAAILPGMSVVVLGGGVIGQLTVQLARLAGARHIVLVTRQASRRRLAETIGATETVDPVTNDVVAAVVGPGGVLPGGADIVLECAGVPETMTTMQYLARPGGTVVVLGVMPRSAKAAIEPFDLLFRELRLFGSFINPFTHRRAVEIVVSGVLDLDSLISREIELDEVPRSIANSARPTEVKVMYVA